MYNLFMTDLRRRFRIIIFAVLGVVIAILVFRILFDISGASPSNVLVQFVDSISNPLISPFYGIVRTPITIIAGLNVDAIIAIVGYLVCSIIFTEIVTSFMEENPELIVENLIDGIFKLIEFLLLIRIVLEIFGIYATVNSPGFVNAVYGTTNWSQGILPNFQFGSGFMDLSAVLCLIVVAILDAITDSILSAIFLRLEQKPVINKTQTKTTFSPVKPVQPYVQSNQPQQSLPQNITVNNYSQPPVQPQIAQPVVQKEVYIHQMQPVIIPVAQGNFNSNIPPVNIGGSTGPGNSGNNQRPLIEGEYTK